MLFRRLLLLLLLAGPAAAGEWFVDTTADHADAVLDGECRTVLGACSLPAAMAEAAASPEEDLIHLPAGSFQQPLPWPAGVTIRGAGRGWTELRTQGAYSAAGRARVEELDLSAPAGLAVDEGTLELSRSGLIVQGTGVGVTVSGGRFELIDSELVAPRQSNWLGEFDWLALHQLAGETLIERSLVRGASVDHSGSGGDLTGVDLQSFRIDAGRFELLNSTVLGNEATGSYDYGSARATGLSAGVGAEVVLSHSTFEGSVANALGGPGSPAFARSATIAGGLSSPGSLLEHSVLLASRQDFGQVVPVCLGGPVISGPSWIEELDPGCEAGSDPSLIAGPGDPELDALSDNGGLTATRSPRSGSPLIDAGDPGLCAGEDQRGIPRPQGAGCDLGAVEVSCGGVEFDRDADGICNDEDICPDAPDTEQLDSDGDGHGDACDACPGVADPDQLDADADGLGDACDNCPLEHDPSGRDSDGDGLGDACECAPNDAADAELRPPVIADLRVSKTAGSPVELRWTDPLAPSGSFSWAYDLAGGALRGDRWSFGCLKDDHPDASIEQDLSGSRWWSVRAATSCTGSWGQPALDDSSPCP